MQPFPNGIIHKRTFQKFFSFQVIAQTALLGAALSCAASADTLNPGDQFTVNFTLQANNADLLYFETNETTSVGSPVVTASLYNGSTLLGTYTSAPQYGPYLDMSFESSTSSYATNSPTVVDFSSLNSGTNAGRLVLTVSGGSLDGLDATSFYAHDATGDGPDGYMPKFDLSITSSDVAPATPGGNSATPEPASFGLASLAAVAVLLTRRKFVKG